MSLGVILLFIGICFVGICSSSPLQPVHSPPGRPFNCQYFSDGTYSCHFEHPEKGPDDKEEISAEGLVDHHEAINGTWTPEDGIMSNFDLKKPKAFVGSCSFSSDASFSCSGPPSFSVDALGNMTGKGGAMFFGRRFSGEPGGRIKLERLVGVAPLPPNQHPALLQTGSTNATLSPWSSSKLADLKTMACKQFHWFRKSRILSDKYLCQIRSASIITVANIYQAEIWFT
jgi:hypothetical protein